MSNFSRSTDPISTAESGEKDTQITSGTHAPSRREALSSTTAATLAAAAATALPSSPASAALPAPPAPGTKAREAKMVMRVTALRGTVPGSWVQDFSTAMEGYGSVAMTQKPQVADIWQELKGEAAESAKKKSGRKKSQPKPTTVDAVSLGDAWMAAAIYQGLIQPIDNAKSFRYWEALSPRWRQLVSRSPNGLLDPNGEVYAVPYRWGCTAVLYRTDTAIRWGGDRSKRISDWDDLLLPGLKGRIAFIDSPRELVGVALKTFGMSYNATESDLAACGISTADLAQRVRRLVDQVKVFSNVDHVRALSAGEVDVVVGWSDDLIPLEQRSASAELAIPISGTALYADMWCVPSAAAGGAEDGEPSPLLPAWLELGLQPARFRKSLRGGAAPLALPAAAKNLEKTCVPVKTKYKGPAKLDDTLMPSDDVLSRSEFLLPVGSKTAALYREVLEAANQLESSFT